MSPSSRRAWIEIQGSRGLHQRKRVALLAEGVDRNAPTLDATPAIGPSPSSRRAWIEIEQAEGFLADIKVALLAEGVDRNLRSRGYLSEPESRPPRGGRG